MALAGVVMLFLRVSSNLDVPHILNGLIIG